MRPCSSLARVAVCTGALFLITPATARPAEDGPPKFPRTPPTEPAAAVATFRTRHGFRMELIAAEPLVYRPGRGRIRRGRPALRRRDVGLPARRPEERQAVRREHARPPDRPAQAPDRPRRRRHVRRRDGPGRQALVAHRGRALEGRGLRRGDARASGTSRTPTATAGPRSARRSSAGFRKYNIQAVMNNLQWGLDHAIYGAGSGNGGEVRRADEPGGPGRLDPAEGLPVPPRRRGRSRRSRAARGSATRSTTGATGSSATSATRPSTSCCPPDTWRGTRCLAAPRALHDVAQAGDAIPMFRISPPEPWREFRARRWAAIGKVMPRSELVGAGYLTSSSGVTDLSGRRLPARVPRPALPRRGRQQPDPPRGRSSPTASPSAPDVPTTGAEFVASTDTWFRPVNFVNAPDGTLHVLDMYRETIEHPWSIPDDIKAGLDLRSGEDRGRIYRLAPPGFRRPAARRSSPGPRPPSWSPCSNTPTPGTATPRTG